MASHEELIAEMPKLEKLSNAARLKHARKRRDKQLKCWKDWLRQERASTTSSIMKKKSEPKIKFEVPALLTDLVNRNDIIGGERRGQAAQVVCNCRWQWN